MKVTYICDRCGAIIGSLGLTEDELQQIGLDLVKGDPVDDVIKSDSTGALFIYSLCDHCVDSAPIYKIEEDCPGE